MSVSVTTQDAPAAGCRSIKQLRELLGHGHSTAIEHVGSVLSAIRAAGPGLGAFLAVAGEEALREAEAADRLVASLGESAWRYRPLLGVTIAVKDLVQTSELPTTRGSLLPNHRAARDAPAVARLRAAGAIVVGKTTTSEYGWSASTVSRVAAPTRNPWAPELTSGGSSGGAAAAVAAGLCTGSLGTDGAGSIRIPAAFCGVVGHKPSFGRIPYVPPCADRLAHAGPIARSVADASALASVMAGAHPADPDSTRHGQVSGRASSALRIGWLEFPRTSAGVRAVTEQVQPILAGQGHRVERLEIPFADPYQALVDILAAGEAASATADDEELCDPGRLAVVRYGRSLTGAAVARAEEVRLALRVTLESVMERYDVLAMATVPHEPFGVGEIAPPWAADPRDLLWLAWSPATYPFNLTGQPALSLPVGLTPAGLPAGLQLVGRVGDDGLVLSLASRIETDLGPWLAPPELPTKG